MKTVLLSLLLLVFAITSVNAAEIKVGFVNISNLMEKAPQAESARTALEREFDGRDNKLTTTRDAILRLEDQLQKDGEIMSESKRADLERDILRRKRDFNREKDELKEDFNIRRNEELGKLQREVYSVIVDVAKKENYDLMVTESVLYASDKIDVTEKILEQLKKSGK